MRRDRCKVGWQFAGAFPGAFSHFSPGSSRTSFLPHDPSAVDIVLSSLHAHIHTYIHTHAYTYIHPPLLHRCPCGKCKVETCAHRPLDKSGSTIPQILLGLKSAIRHARFISLFSLLPSPLSLPRTRCNVTRCPPYLLSPHSNSSCFVMIPLPSAHR